MALERTAACLMALAAGAGATDAASYLGLGHVFTANMTGNTVLLALAAVKGSGADALRSATALGGFSLGVAGGVAVLGARRRRWPALAARAFALETIALAALLGLWEAVGVRPARFALIALAAAAMGAQSAAVRASDVRGVNTTYMTSTLQNAIARLVQRERRAGAEQRAPGLPGATWLVYGFGALAGAWATQAWSAAVIAAPLIVLLAIAAAAALQAEKEREDGSEHR